MTFPPDRPVPAGAWRAARCAMRAAPDFEMLPSLKRGLPLCAPMDPDQIARIDEASMAILEDVGVIFRDDIALADWKRAGAKVEGERVYRLCCTNGVMAEVPPSPDGPIPQLP